MQDRSFRSLSNLGFTCLLHIVDAGSEEKTTRSIVRFFFTNPNLKFHLNGFPMKYPLTRVNCTSVFPSELLLFTLINRKLTVNLIAVVFQSSQAFPHYG